MYNYGELELLILSCIWIEPKLLDTTKLKEEHFINNKKIFIFFKSFYKKFGFFDNELACRKASDRYKYNEYIKVLAKIEPTISHFNKYEDLLLELYNESKVERYLREKIFELANNLYMKNISSVEFKNQVDNLYNNIEEIFKK